jgi:hypothetical protein
MEYEGELLCSQQLATDLYSQLDKLNPNSDHYFTLMYFSIIFFIYA